MNDAHVHTLDHQFAHILRTGLDSVSNGFQWVSHG